MRFMRALWYCGLGRELTARTYGICLNLRLFRFGLMAFREFDILAWTLFSFHFQEKQWNYSRVRELELELILSQMAQKPKLRG